jgi:SAM-dependent MidA family methyltransferase
MQEGFRYPRVVTGHPALIEAISGEIARAGGRIRFERFMELALYHPHHGYYTSGRARIGKAGDFFTSVSVGPLFGKILARYFRQLGVESVLEIGGHHGQLRQDVLAAAPDLQYRVIEFGEQLPERITGCVFSNEFFDALPVHRVAGEREVYVVERASRPLPETTRPKTGRDAPSRIFSEELGPRSDPRLPRLPEGYRSEFNLRALDWLTDTAQRLAAGSYVLTIDYGFERAEYFSPRFKDGHLQCYHRHRRSGNPYQHIGEQDITAHVEFTSLMEHPAFETVLFTTQERFLMKVGAEELAAAPRQASQLLTMGHAFKVLVQRKR